MMTQAELSDVDRNTVLHRTQRLNFEFPELELAVPYFVLSFINTGLWRNLMKCW